MGMAGLRTKEDVATLVKAVAPRPVNVLVMGPGITVAEYADIGVRRISVGGALAQVAGAAVLQRSKRLEGGLCRGPHDGVGRHRAKYFVRAVCMKIRKRFHDLDPRLVRK
jgi:2-methylisocitrate lyase-like PEP mutase family enzyme